MVDNVMCWIQVSAPKLYRIIIVIITGDVICVTSPYANDSTL